MAPSAMEELMPGRPAGADGRCLSNSLTVATLLPLLTAAEAQGHEGKPRDPRNLQRVFWSPDGHLPEEEPPDRSDQTAESIRARGQSGPDGTAERL